MPYGSIKEVDVMHTGYKNVYKKHFQFCLKTLSAICALFVITSLIVILLLNQLFAPHYDIISATVQKLGYAGAVETLSQNDGIDPLFKLDNLVTVKSVSGRKANVNLYATVSNEQNKRTETFYGLSKKALKENEIIISEKVSRALKVSVGDSILLEYTFRDVPTEYTIAEISEYMTDYYDFEKNSDFSIAVVGPENRLDEKTSGKYVSLINEDEYSTFISGERSYLSIYNIKDEVNHLFQMAHLKTIIIGVVYLCLAVALLVIIHKAISNEILKYYRFGYPVKKVLQIRNYDYVFFVGVPQAIVLIVLLLTVVDNSFNLISFLVLLGISIILLIVSLVRRGKYANAN